MFCIISTRKATHKLIAILQRCAIMLVACILLVSQSVSAKDYKYESNCIEKLFELEDDVDLPEEGNNYCTATRAMLMIANFGMIGLLIQLGIRKAVAEGVASNSSLCDYEIHPMPYTDDQIITMLKKQGKQGSIREVSDYYDKICFQYNGDTAWIGKDECVSLNGILFCATTPKWSDQMICVRIASTCPCVDAISHGSMEDPTFVKDDNGEYVFDENGNPKIEGEDSFKQYFAKHCNMITEVDSMPLKPDEYRGIIDEVCNTGWSGYSKVALPLSSGAVQCLQSTMQNIFQKPMGIGEDPNAGNYVMDGPTMKKYNDFQADRKLVATTAEEGRNILVDVSNRPLYSNSDFLNIAQKLQNISNRSSFISEYKADYMIGLSPVIVNTANDQSNSTQLTKAIADLIALSQAIDNRTNQFLESTQKSSKTNALTIFETVQGPFRLVAFFAVLLYITNIGAQIILGNFPMEMSNILKSFMKLGFVYYFALGDAWKEYFYQMTFDVSIGISELIFESILGNSELTSKCNFISPHYVVNKTDTCNFPNPSQNGSKQPQYFMDDYKSGQPIYICTKGPFIFKPNYERPYKPFKYYETSANGLSVAKVVQMYCINSKGQKEPAKLITDDVSGDPKRWICQDAGYSLEDGYRVGEIAKVGIDVSKIDTSLSSSDVLPTAMFSLDSEGTLTDLYPPRSSTTTKIKEKLTKFKVINAIELQRSNTNKNLRQYPEVYQFGVKRSYNYVGLFDMIDCKLLEYFRYNSIDGFDILAGTDPIGIIFGGLMVIVLMVMIIFTGLFIAGMVGRIVQAYLVSIVAITVLIYFTPIIMPMSLFKATEGFYQEWKDKLIGYAFFPAVLFLSAAMSFVIMDYSMYGSTETFKEKSMFTSEGKIDGKNCWENNWWQAPTGCLLGKLKHHTNKVNFLGLSFSVGPNPELAVATIFALFKTMLVTLMITATVSKFESAFSEMMGISADVSLEGSIFNEPGGLQSAMKKFGQGTINAAKKGFSTEMAEEKKRKEEEEKKKKEEEEKSKSEEPKDEDAGNSEEANESGGENEESDNNSDSSSSAGSVRRSMPSTVSGSGDSGSDVSRNSSQSTSSSKPSVASESSSGEKPKQTT